MGSTQSNNNSSPKPIKNELAEFCNELKKNDEERIIKSPRIVQLPQGCAHSKTGICGDKNFFAITLDDILSEKECQLLIDISEKKGFEPALVNVGGGKQIYSPGIRNNDRSYIDSPKLAEIIWQRMKHAVPEKINEWTVVGLNERLRVLRYGVGHEFLPHLDGAYQRGDEAGDRKNELSFITVLLYLNGGMEGGQTFFLDRSEYTKSEIKPIPGRALLFEHKLYHQGAPVLGGHKYVIRTDIMYTKKGENLEYSKIPLQMTDSDDLLKKIIFLYFLYFYFYFFEN
eukprot:c12063_g1_i1.p1 GENE.c12063_g1_i1~~c12063_g1_i1.p1  ORF type:complete len:285 (+),score=117.96 c12063_g1_i1:133-987(+)